MMESKKDDAKKMERVEDGCEGITLDLDCISVVFLHLILLSKEAKDEWMNWRLVSVGVKEIVDRIYLKEIGSECRSLEAFFLIPHLYNSLNMFEKHRNIEDYEMDKMVKILKEKKNLSEINLAVNRMGNQDAIALSNGLMHCKSLSMLDLSQNYIQEEGAIAIGSIGTHQSHFFRYKS
eukprot:TRINITY_DN7152_c0_g1_i1.p1 TRINITY_DN7152_c0_g1~~TRINITY_DN7152_c0_g1_i1.p1  ORF type:complete len:178 (-),score=49.55 TRINITY_DN7152_c0_g1_i1:279-812(-)